MQSISTITTIISLLVLWASCNRHANYHEVVTRITRLNAFFGFDHNIFLLDSPYDHGRCIPTGYNKDDHFTPQTVYIFDFNTKINQSSYRRAKLTFERMSKKAFIIVVTESLNFGRNTQLVDHIEAIREFEINVKVGVFFMNSNYSITNIMDAFCRWSGLIGIRNIFSAFLPKSIEAEWSLNVYRCESTSLSGPYHLINVTDSATTSVSLRKYFLDNYRSKKFLFDTVSDVYNDETPFSFFGILHTFLNASVGMVLNTENGYYDEDSSLDTEYIPHEEYLKSVRIYPYRMITKVLLVPHARPYSGFVEYLQNSTWKLFFAYAFIVVAAASLLLTISGYWQTKKFSLMQCVGDVINLLLNDNGTIRYGQLHRADIYVAVPLTFTGLIMMNGIVSVFQSYLTVPIYERQINSIEDLCESSTPILAEEYFWTRRTIATLTDLSPHSDWKDKVHATYYESRKSELDNFNNSVAFATFLDEAQWYLKAQERLNLKQYKLLADVNLYTFFVTLHLRNDFYLLDPINDLVHLTQSSGILAKWLRENDEKQVERVWKASIRLKLKNDCDEREDVVFNAVPPVIWYGWATSVVAFVCEITWNKTRSQIKTMKKKIWVRLHVVAAKIKNQPRQKMLKIVGSRYRNFMEKLKHPSKIGKVQELTKIKSSH